MQIPPLKKSKFFFGRIIIYFSFLLIPVWVQKSLDLNQAFQSFIMVLYIFFMAGQWFFLGKEIDHRLKIYFRVNSSIDRIIYRFFIGMCFFSLYFNILNLLPHKWIYNFFWTTWVVLGLFYSWPTRGRIIRESVASNFGEFKYLDAFEKTLVAMSAIILIISIPEPPTLNGKEALKLFFDNEDNFSPMLWDFLTVNYYPFYKYPQLFKVAWCMHFYVVGIGFFLLTFYSLLRFLFSRRLSLLGIFALLSSWSFTKILEFKYGFALSTTYSLIWVWSILWVVKSSTYRVGLFSGLVAYLGTLINPIYAFLSLIQTALIHFYFLKDKTKWFKRQFFKYSVFGLTLSTFVLFIHLGDLNNINHPPPSYLNEVLAIINRKSFNIIAIFGLIILLIKYFSSQIKSINELSFDTQRTGQIGMLLLIITIYSVTFQYDLIRGFGTMWPTILLALIPLELIFQSIRRLRSSRNMIYLIYILICLLDSHLESRVKIFLKLFNHDS